MYTRPILATLTLLTLTTFIPAKEAKKATPPSAKELVGTWIGFDQDELTFTRLELHADSTGYLARVSPAETILHDYGVQVYHVNKWSVTDWNVAIDLTPISSNAEVVYLKGRAGMADLDLEIGGLNKKWKLKVLLYPESRIEMSNRETKQAIEAASVTRGSVDNVTQCDGASVAVPSCWHKLDAGPFSISAPRGWGFDQLPGVDSYVGQFVGDGVVLTFDFGRYSTELRKAKKPAYVISKKRVDKRRAKVVRPQALGSGITGVYVRVSGHEALCLWGKGLTSPQQELVLKMFDTIRFGGPMPPSLIPLPPPPPARDAD